MDFKNTSVPIDWKTTIFIVTYQVALVAALPFYFYNSTPSFSLIAVSFILFLLTGISITAGYHRFYAHKTYDVNPVAEFFLLLFGTMAIQGSALQWSNTHRIHHRFVDSEKDPHNIHKGFWYAHIIWIFHKMRTIDPEVVPDLLKRKVLVFQHKYYGWLALGTNMIAFLLIGYFLHDFIGAFLLAGWLRIFCVHHFTWFINSLAHTWGSKTYSHEQTAVNNAIISLVTFGEGYHNYHHVFASDYRNGVRWYQFDPTKWLIWSLNKLGLASNLTRVDSYILQKKIVMQDKKIFLDALKESTNTKKTLLEQKVNEISEKINSNINSIKLMVQEYRELKKAKAKKSALRKAKQEISSLRSHNKTNWKLWSKLEREIVQIAPLTHHHA